MTLKLLLIWVAPDEPRKPQARTSITSALRSPTKRGTTILQRSHRALFLQYFASNSSFYFLPFFFFFPTVFALAFGSAGTPPIFTSPLSSSAGVETRSPPIGALRSSGISGNAAICLPSLPRLPTSLPTSAPLFVSYCRHVPDSGSNVLSVNVIVTSSGLCKCGGGDEERVASVDLEACLSAYACRFFIFEDVGLSIVYFDVIRVYDR